MKPTKLPMFDVPEPQRVPSAFQHTTSLAPRSGSCLGRSDSTNPATWERTPGRLTTRELSMLEAIDPSIARSFNQPEMLALYEDVAASSPLTPDVSMDPSFTRRQRQDVHPLEPSPSVRPEDLEQALEAIQRQLDVLTEAKEKKESKRGKEGDQDPNDPTDLLLAHGLRALLHRIMLLNGPNKYIGVLVKFDRLTFKARTFEGSEVIATNGSQLMQLLTFWRRSRTQERYVLNNVTGSFRPSRTCLVLGPPRSGKSTLMKAIAGRLEETRHAKLQGTIEYAGERLREKPQPKDGIKLVKLVGYVPQVDVHIPTLTVRETVNFAGDCVARPSPKNVAAEGWDEKANRAMALVDQLNTEILLSLLGIRHVGDTIVGNETLRGVSGGQRKRLTSGEIMATQTPVLMMDEISTGLDSATTFEICTALKSFARCYKRNVVVSLLQPTPETYSTFDEVLVMAAGSIAYHGPRQEVLPYFLDLGFRSPEGKDAAEFLQEVTLPSGLAKYRVPGRKPRVEIHEPEDFGPAWQSSRLFQQRQEEDLALDEQSKYELSCLPPNSFGYFKLTSNYTQAGFRSMQLILKRQAVLTLRNVAIIKSRVVQVVVGGFLLGSLFFQLPLDDYNSKYSVLYFAMLFMSVSGFAMIPGIIAERQVVYRQAAAHFFHPLPYSIASSIVDLPLSTVETFVFITIIYWMAGLAADATLYFGAMLTIFLVKASMNGCFRVLATLAPNQAVAQAMASIVLLLFILHSGFFLAYANVKSYFLWVYWINPMQYGMTTLSINEFRSAKYDVLRNAGDPSLGTWGDFYLSVKGMPGDDHRVWLGWIFNTGFYFLTVVVNSIILTFVRYPQKFPPQPPQPTEGIKLNDAEPIAFTPYTLAWKSIVYDVDIPGKKGKEAKLGLRLLNGVSGFAKPGTLTALMGSSGAGKTTLLDVLAGRKNTGRVEGDILLNGQRADPITFSRVSGYVEQMDIHSPSATVAEALRFSAFLRLPRETPDAEKEAFVWQVISMLNLQQVAHSPVGTRQDGLSVEQVKRVTIGVEMAANPAVLFLDEPTSGLDSMAADVVMDALKAVAASGRTLICTIHQPSSYLFGMFGHLLLMMRGGKTVFFGETGHNSDKLVAYFNAIPGAPQHDGEQNPATWMLNVMATEGVKFDEEYRASQLCARNEEELALAMEVSGQLATSGHLYQATLQQQYKLLLRKWFVLHWRSPGYNLARFFTCVVIALLIGAVCFQQTMDTQQAVFTMVGLQYIVLLFIAIMFANTMQGIIAVERTVFYREKAAHMYYPWLYNLTMGFAELPYITLYCLIFTCIYYWMVGLEPDAAVFFTWYLIFWLYVLYFAYFGLFLGCVMPSAELASMVAGATTSFGSLMAGFMLPKDSIPWWWRWLYYINPMTYSVQPILSAQFYCEAADLTPDQPGNCRTFVQQTLSGDSNVVPVWTFVRDTFNLSYGDRWMYVGILVLCIAIVRAACALALTYVNHAKR